MNYTGDSARVLFANALFKFAVGLDVLALAEYNTRRRDFVLPVAVRQYFQIASDWIDVYDLLLNWVDAQNAGAQSPEQQARVWAKVQPIGDVDNLNYFYVAGDGAQGGAASSTFALPSIIAVYAKLIEAMRCNSAVPKQYDVDASVGVQQLALALARSMPPNAPPLKPSSTPERFVELFNKFLLTPPDRIAINATDDAVRRDGVGFNFVVTRNDVGEPVLLDCRTVSAPDPQNVFTVVGSRLVGLPIALERNLYLGLETLDLSQARIEQRADIGADIGDGDGDGVCTPARMLQNLQLIAAAAARRDGAASGFRLGLHADFSSTTPLEYATPAGGPDAVVKTLDRLSTDPFVRNQLHENFVALVASQRPYCRQDLTQNRAGQ